MLQRGVQRSNRYNGTSCLDPTRRPMTRQLVLRKLQRVICTHQTFQLNRTPECKSANCISSRFNPRTISLFNVLEIHPDFCASLRSCRCEVVRERWRQMRRGGSGGSVLCNGLIYAFKQQMNRQEGNVIPAVNKPVPQDKSTCVCTQTTIKNKGKECSKSLA